LALACGKQVSPASIVDIRKGFTYNLF